MCIHASGWWAFVMYCMLVPCLFTCKLCVACAMLLLSSRGKSCKEQDIQCYASSFSGYQMVSICSALKWVVCCLSSVAPLAARAGAVDMHH
ncbi:hypothetical protein COO60DRAFT_1580341 [Scenedesmus sp. NREL 46B-D3]|nr:hypothetical protein COO60DRAFT_1580341 [Scenedesmus sp. NREL 46B-D3]